MKNALFSAVAAVSLLAGGAWIVGASNAPSSNTKVTPKIAWYATLDSGLAEAARSNRPILFIAGAPQCLGVPGTW